MMRRVRGYVRYLWRLTEGYHTTAAVRTLAGVVRVGATLTFIWLSKTAIDCATGRVAASTSELAGWFGLMVGCILAEVAAGQWARYLETRSVVRMTNEVDRRLYNVLMEMPAVNGRQGFHSGDMLNRLTVDVRTVASFALSQLPSMVVLGVQLAGAFAFLAWLNPWLALAPVVIMPVCMVGSKLYFRRQRRLTAETRAAESEVQISMQEGLKHRMVLRSLECVGELDRRLGEILGRLDGANREQTRLSTASGTMVRLGFVAGYLTAFGWSIFSLQAGVISFGTMTAFIQLVNRIQHPIAGIAGYIPSFISVSVAIDRLREIDVEPARTREGGLVEGRAGVRVKDVSFRYERGSREVLSHFSHDFRPGSRTMIVGATGAGKTTLIKLLLGLLRPDRGCIEIYGDGLSREAGRWTMGNFVYVPQGNSLLHGTIRENLLLGRPEATDAELMEALRGAAADFVEELPMGLDTYCDEAGAGISEGQAQRIAIARALLRPGSILLLDEVNSALDAATAETLMARLAERRGDATVIIIAHHQSAITPYCDEVLRIDRGA